MRKMGIDASTTCTGWCIFDGETLTDYNKIKPTIKNLEWRDRIQNMIPQITEIVEKYNPDEVFVEDVPLIKTKGMKTILMLGALQGAILGIFGSLGVKVTFIPVGTWRSDIGLYDGTTEGKERDLLKQHSIERANELFELDLKYFTPSSIKNDDDISDSILICASTIDKYKATRKVLGRRGSHGVCKKTN